MKQTCMAYHNLFLISAPSYILYKVMVVTDMASHFCIYSGKVMVVYMLMEECRERFSLICFLFVNQQKSRYITVRTNKVCKEWSIKLYHQLVLNQFNVGSKDYSQVNLIQRTDKIITKLK